MRKGEKVFFWIASSVVSVYIDEERPREYLGELDGYNAYTEQMRSEEMIVIAYDDCIIRPLIYFSQGDTS